MATYTENYNLEKPSYADPMDIMVLNDNSDIIDGALATHDRELNSKIDAEDIAPIGNAAILELFRS